MTIEMIVTDGIVLPLLMTVVIVVKEGLGEELRVGVDVPGADDGELAIDTTLESVDNIGIDVTGVDEGEPALGALIVTVVNAWLFEGLEVDVDVPCVLMGGLLLGLTVTTVDTGAVDGEPLLELITTVVGPGDVDEGLLLGLLATVNVTIAVGTELVVAGIVELPGDGVEAEDCPCVTITITIGGFWTELEPGTADVGSCVVIVAGPEADGEEMTVITGGVPIPIGVESSVITVTGPEVDGVERTVITGGVPIPIGVDSKVITVVDPGKLDVGSSDITGPGPIATGEESRVTTVDEASVTLEDTVEVLKPGEMLLTVGDGELPELPLMTIVVMDGVGIVELVVIMDISVTVLGVLALPSEVVTVTIDGDVELEIVDRIETVDILCV